MRTVTTKPEVLQPPADNSSCLFDNWFDPIEAGLRERVRELIEEMIRSELDAVLSRPRYGRRTKEVAGEEIAGVAGYIIGSLSGSTAICRPSISLPPAACVPCHRSACRLGRA